MTSASASKPLVLGIAGGSGSGKSTFAAALVERLRPLKTAVISTDGFFKRPLPTMISPVSGKTYDDWNSPDAIDIDRLLEAVDGLLVSDASVVIIEGLSVFCFNALLKLMDLKVFIDLPSDERMYRRIRRNMKMWNVSMEEVADYYLEAAKFAEEKHFLPTRVKADMIVNGYVSYDRPLALIDAWVKAQS